MKNLKYNLFVNWLGSFIAIGDSLICIFSLGYCNKIYGTLWMDYSIKKLSKWEKKH